MWQINLSAYGQFTMNDYYALRIQNKVQSKKTKRTDVGFLQADFATFPFFLCSAFSGFYFFPFSKLCIKLKSLLCNSHTKRNNSSAEY